ncbi:MAG: D-erythrose-4-phosphate dehydrogenase [Betaproteobacteria bacterium ADurb.Bin341]|nr:MAG: D-erythrose-4-phosphate dehydrogenase [Betaproteobacteria bacterium ADurb.Bin341]
MSPKPQRRLAINGFGRIGRCFLRALHETGKADQLQVVLINEPAEAESIAYLARFDSTHGRFPGTVRSVSGGLEVNGRCIALTHAKAPEEVDWRHYDIDLLVECSGRYTRRAQIERFLAAGCPRLLLSQPAQGASDVDATVVFGLNHDQLTGRERILSSASCTTNAIVPVLKLLHDAYGVEHALLTTLHSLMNDQPVLDGYHHHTDLRCMRSAMQSLIPVSTGLARGVARLLPELTGRVEAKAIRVPVINVSAVDLVASLAKPATAEEINTLLKEAAIGRFPGLLAYSDDPHASVDFIHNPHSAIVDGCQTRMSGARLANVMVWFDNEWGYVNRMIDLVESL